MPYRIIDVAHAGPRVALPVVDDVRSLSAHLMYRDPDDGHVAPAWDVRVDRFDVRGGAHAAALGLNPAFAKRWETAYANGPDTFFGVASDALDARLAESFGGDTGLRFAQAGENGGFLVLRSVDGIGLSFAGHADWAAFLAELASTGSDVLARVAAVAAAVDAAVAHPTDCVEAAYARARRIRELAWQAGREADVGHDPTIERVEEAGVSLYRDALGGWWALGEEEETGPYASEAEAAVTACLEHGLAFGHGPS